MYPNTFNPMYPNQGNPNLYPNQGNPNMYPEGPNQMNPYEQMEKLERKVSRLERQVERLESRVRKLEGGYPVPLSTGREYNSDNNHYMI